MLSRHQENWAAGVFRPGPQPVAAEIPSLTADHQAALVPPSKTPCRQRARRSTSMPAYGPTLDAWLRSLGESEQAAHAVRPMLRSVVLVRPAMWLHTGCMLAASWAPAVAPPPNGTVTFAQRKWCVCILPRLAHVPSGPDRGAGARALLLERKKTAATSLRPPELDVAPPPCLAPGAMAPQRPQIQFQPPSPDSFPVQAVVMQQPLISSLAPAARLPISNSLLSGPPTGTKQPTSGGGPRHFLAHSLPAADTT